MKNIYITFLLATFFNSYSQEQQQQEGNLDIQNNINISTQNIQIANYSNIANLSNDNKDSSPISQQQVNVIDNNVLSELAPVNAGNYTKQADDAVLINGNAIDLSFNFSSRFSNKKHYKHTFHKKIVKLNRNLYGKMTLHKKSKHLVDVCFFWNK